MCVRRPEKCATTVPAVSRAVLCLPVIVYRPPDVARHQKETGAASKAAPANCIMKRLAYRRFHAARVLLPRDLVRDVVVMEVDLLVATFGPEVEHEQQVSDSHRKRHERRQL